jgi:GDP-4-dehydro-6-deoxy-D-mannose reductase
MAAETLQVNLFGTINVLQALQNTRVAKIVLVSSADIYGQVKPSEMPLTPAQLFNPVSPYGRSKAAAEFAASIFCRQYHLPIIFVRAFNHTGPRQNLNFAIPSFCFKIAVAEKSPRHRSIAVGDLSVHRDISDVRDIVRGYRLLAEKGRVGLAYHLCSGESYRLADLLGRLLSYSTAKIQIKKDRLLVRKADIPMLQGDFRATTRATGWRPRIPIDTTLRDTLEYWRRKLRT